MLATSSRTASGGGANGCSGVIARSPGQRADLHGKTRQLSGGRASPETLLYPAACCAPMLPGLAELRFRYTDAPFEGRSLGAMRKIIRSRDKAACISARLSP